MAVPSSLGYKLGPAGDIRTCYSKLEEVDTLRQGGMFGDAARRAAWEPADDPRCQQFRAAGDSSWLLGHCFKIIMMQVRGGARLRNCVRLGLNAATLAVCRRDLPWWRARSSDKEIRRIS